MSDLFDRPVVPLASESDALATIHALQPHLQAGESVVTLVHVVEKAGGAPDKASVEQREEKAEEIFNVALDVLADDDVYVESEIRYHIDVATAIVDAAADADATAIVFTPRGGSKWVKLLTGDVADTLVETSDRPVVTLPDVEADDG